MDGTGQYVALFCSTAVKPAQGKAHVSRVGGIRAEPGVVLKVGLNGGLNGG